MRVSRPVQPPLLRVACSAMNPLIGLIKPHMPQRLLLAMTMATAGGLAGCGLRTPAASTNEVFTPRETYGSEGPELVRRNPGLQDEFASQVLDWQQRAQVWDALSAMASGSVYRLKPARDGLRFSDVPRAVRNAVQQVEMALLDTTHSLPRLDLEYRDRDGLLATLMVTFHPRGPLVNVEYAEPSDDVRLPRALVRANATRAFDRLRTTTLESVRAAAIASIEAEGGRVLGSWEVPERYTFRIMMLDGQPAKLDVVRAPSPVVAKWEAWAGVFPDEESADRLGKAFLNELSAWGRVPEMPTEPGIFDDSTTR